MERRAGSQRLTIINSQGNRHLSLIDFMYIQTRHELCMKKGTVCKIRNAQAAQRSLKQHEQSTRELWFSLFLCYITQRSAIYRALNNEPERKSVLTSSFH